MSTTAQIPTQEVRAVAVDVTPLLAIANPVERLDAARTLIEGVLDQSRADIQAVQAVQAAAVVEARATGLSNTDIGKLLDPPLSRERVRQIEAAGNGSAIATASSN